MTISTEWRDFVADLEAVRAVPPAAAVETRAAGDDDMPTMLGHFSVFNRWYEIDSFFEGHFLERVAPGAFSKTFRERRDKIRVLFNHGHDAQIGSKVLGPIADLREDGVGAYYEVPLLDTSYNRDLIPGLEAGAYGASFRFATIIDEWNDEPGSSDHNPDGIPERTLKEVRVFEFGPVTFPANDDATAGIRSMTDQFYREIRDINPDHYNQLLSRAREIRTPQHPSGGRDGAATTAEEPRQHSAGMTQAERRQVVRRKHLQQKGLL